MQLPQLGVRTEALRHAPNVMLAKYCVGSSYLINNKFFKLHHFIHQFDILAYMY